MVSIPVFVCLKRNTCVNTTVFFLAFHILKYTKLYEQFEQGSYNVHICQVWTVQMFKKCCLTYQTSAMVHSTSECLHFQSWNYSDELQMYFGLEYLYFKSRPFRLICSVHIFQACCRIIWCCSSKYKYHIFKVWALANKLEVYRDCSHFLFVLMFI